MEGGLTVVVVASVAVAVLTNYDHVPQVGVICRHGHGGGPSGAPSRRGNAMFHVHDQKSTRELGPLRGRAAHIRGRPVAPR